MTYNAIICEVNEVKPHPNADRIKLANIIGYQVIVGLNIKEHDIGILFPDDGQLSPEYCQANDLIAYEDENGNKSGGYFDNNRRVRAQKFRGEKSEAYFAPLSSVSFTGYDISKLKVGDRFSELNNISICNKYINEKTRHVAQSNKKKTVKEKLFTKQFNAYLKNIFPEHFETSQFKQCSDKILPGSLITLTSKNHGTSGRVSYLPVIQKKKWYERVFDFITKNKDYKTAYDYVHGSRRVILTKDGCDDFYHNTDFRHYVLERFKGKLNKNEIAYFEICGFCASDRPIMSVVDTSKLKDKEFTKRFGKTMVYKYGCINGTCDIYVYRMAVINPDGVIEEMPWNRVKQRCSEMGIKHVVEIDQFILDDKTDLRSIVKYHVEEVDIADPIDDSHIKEGICIRVDDKNGRTKIYKEKTFIFKVLEGIAKDSDVEDMEEVESLLENSTE